MSEILPEHPQSRLHRLFDRNFLDYTAYVIRERAIPDIDDGLKPVQRRILQTLRNMDDGRYHKVANVVGETMKLPARRPVHLCCLGQFSQQRTAH